MKLHRLLSVSLIVGLLGFACMVHADLSDNLLQNSGAEDELNSWDHSYTDVLDSSGVDGLYPHSGNYSFRNSVPWSYNGTCQVIQVIDVSSYQSIINTGSAEIYVNLWTAAWSDGSLDDEIELKAEFISEFGELLSTKKVNRYPGFVSDIWLKQDPFSELIPVETTIIKFYISIQGEKSIAFDDISFQIQWEVNNSFIELDEPKQPISASDGNAVTIKWSTHEDMPEDQIIISMKRDSVNQSETVPDDQNWFQFTDHGASNYNDGIEEITIPGGLTKADDWRFYVRGTEINNSPILLVFQLVFCVASKDTYFNMLPLMRLEYELKSCAIFVELFISVPLRAEESDIWSSSEPFVYNGSIEDELDDQYQAGRQACIDDPASCGITINGSSRPLFTGELPENIQSYLVLTDNSAPFYLTPGSYVQSFGSNGNNTVNVEKLARVQFQNFIGANEINIEEESLEFTVYRSGARVYLNSIFGTRIEIAATQTPQTLRFGNGSSELVISSGNVFLGNQIIDGTETIVEAPINSSDNSQNIF